METGIRHMVIFTLNAGNAIADSDFLEQSRKILSHIPNVKDFEVVKQFSVKNSFQYGFSMAFKSDEEYASYSNHPDHTKYLTDYWFKFVKDFFEIDYKTI